MRRLLIHWLAERLYWQLQKLSDFTSLDADLSTILTTYHYTRRKR